MNLETKFNINDTVFYLISKSDNVGDFKVVCGIIRDIAVKCDHANCISITYTVVSNEYGPRNLRVSEENIFGNEKDLMKFFTENMRVQLESVESRRNRLEAVEIPEITKEDYDDLPF